MNAQLNKRIVAHTDFSMLYVVYLLDLFCTKIIELWSVAKSYDCLCYEICVDDDLASMSCALNCKY